MIAGGTGITPMLQIIRAAMKNPLDLTKINLIYANVSNEDILLKAELDDLATRYPARFSVYYVLNNPPEAWDGGIGFVTKDMIEKHMPSTDANIKILLCGAFTSSFEPQCASQVTHLFLMYRPPTNVDSDEVSSRLWLDQFRPLNAYCLFR
jgi:ferredoxin-NADP reductase